MDIVSFRQDGENLRKNMSFQELLQEGSKSNQVAFINCLTDKRKVTNGKCAIVGFTLHTNEALVYETYRLNDKFKNLMDCTATGVRQVEANSDFIVSLREMVGLISRVEYAGTFSGGDKVAYLSGKDIGMGKYILPMVKLKDCTISNYCKCIQDENGNILPEYEEKFGVINTRQVVKTSYSDDSVKNIAAAFRDLYS